MGYPRRTADLVTENNIFVDIANDRVGVGTDQPTVKLDVVGDAAISGNLNVGGVLTYEDVTNIDAIGIITARSDLQVSGDSTFTGSARFNGGIKDAGGSLGVNGYVLKTDGADIDWVDPTTVAGLQGIQGITGAQGTQGTQGITGTQGIQGIQGITGTQGTQGTQGIQGAQGAQGTQGTQGIQGTQGTQGITGAQGTQGTQGITGAQGAQGTQGVQGIQGTQGILGTQGTVGGFTGTFATNTWYSSSDSRQRLYFASTSHTYIKSSDNIYFRTENSDTNNAYVASGSFTGVNFNSTSDIRLKKDIEVITSATELLNDINGVKFTWKDNDRKCAGVIAQEVEKVLPELVNTADDGVKSVNYDGLVGVLIESVKELKAEIEELKKTR